MNKKYLSVYFVFLLLVSAAFLCALTLKNLQVSDTVSVQPMERCLIIDPGHGGIDGGAIAFHGGGPLFFSPASGEWGDHSVATPTK